MFKRNRKKLVLLAVMAIAAAVASLAAWAYFTSHATSQAVSGGNLGTASNCTGTTTSPAGGDCSLTVMAWSASGLTPGTSTTVPFLIKQNGGGSGVSRTFNLLTPSYSVTSGDPGCQAMITANPGSFTETGLTWTQDSSGNPISGTGVQTLTSPASTINGMTGQFTLNFVNLASVDQGACAGKDLSVLLGI